MKRREFIKNIAQQTTPFVVGGLLGGVAAKTVHIISNKTHQWKMLTAWRNDVPILPKMSEMLALEIQKLSRGQINIEVLSASEQASYRPAFELVQSGEYEMMHSSPALESYINPIFEIFTSIPLAFNTAQFNNWLENQGGKQIWQRLAADYGIIPVSAGNLGDGLGEWHMDEITDISSYKYRKIRMLGMGAKILSKMGGNVVYLDSNQVAEKFAAGDIAAAEVATLQGDIVMGLHNIAKYFYSPSWHEPTCNLEVLINQKAYLQLPKDLQKIVQESIKNVSNWSLKYFSTAEKNIFETLKQKNRVHISGFPQNVQKELRIATINYLEPLIKSDYYTRKSGLLDQLHKSFYKNT